MDRFGGFKKCTSILTDGAVGTVGNKIGLAGLLKENGINCLIFHWIFHTQKLINKTDYYLLFRRKFTKMYTICKTCMFIYTYIHVIFFYDPRLSS